MDNSRRRPDVNFYSWDEKILDVTRLPQDILKRLVEAKEKGSSIGVLSSVLGESYVVTAVDDIILEDGGTLIVFKPYDNAGAMLSRNRLSLAEIEAVCPLASEFRDPVLKNIEKGKNWFF